MKNSTKIFIVCSTHFNQKASDVYKDVMFCKLYTRFKIKKLQTNYFGHQNNYLFYKMFIRKMVLIQILECFLRMKKTIYKKNPLKTCRKSD